MVFLGDIAVPNRENMPRVDRVPWNGREQNVVANLEGTLVSDGFCGSERPTVFNSESALEMLRLLGVNAVTLSNNHSWDIPESFGFMKDKLEEADISYCGAGKNIQEASRYITVKEDGQRYAVFGFCWDVTGGVYASEKTKGVNPLEIDYILKCIQSIRQREPESRIVLLLHWNYELEKYPMPLHREYAKRAIDAGADLIVGHHPHCINGYEYYKGKLIIYSLGNFCFKEGYYINGTVQFPEYAHQSFALEINNDSVLCHWFEMDVSQNKVNYQYSEPLQDSKNLKEISNFAGMTDREYYQWFKKKRVKKKGLPVFSSCNRLLSIKNCKRVVVIRKKVLDCLWKIGVIKSRSGLK